MKRNLMLAIIFAVLLFLQSSIVHLLPVVSAFPDLVLVGIIIIGIVRGYREGAIFGLILGLIQDVLYGDIVGINALAKFAAGYYSGYMIDILFKGNIFIPFLLTFSAALLHEIIIIAVMYLFTIRFPLFYSLVYLILPFSLYCGILGILFYKWFNKLNRWEKLT